MSQEFVQQVVQQDAGSGSAKWQTVTSSHKDGSLLTSPIRVEDRELGQRLPTQDHGLRLDLSAPVWLNGPQGKGIG